LVLDRADCFLHEYHASSADVEQTAMKQAPCKGCLKRSAHPNCHITCELYAEFVHTRQMYIEQRKQRSMICDYIDTIKRKRKKGRR
jgi:hypothetical protein